MFERVLRKVRGFTQSLHGPFNMEQYEGGGENSSSCDDKAAPAASRLARCTGFGLQLLHTKYSLDNR